MEGVRIQGIFHLFLIFIFSMIFMWIGITYVSQNIQYSSAQKFFGNVIRELENQHFSAEAVNECRERAKRNGYSFRIDEFGEGEHRDARVVLTFSFTFPIIQKVQQYTLEGYAR